MAELLSTFAVLRLRNTSLCPHETDKYPSVNRADHETRCSADEVDSRLDPRGVGAPGHRLHTDEDERHPDRPGHGVHEESACCSPDVVTQDRPLRRRQDWPGDRTERGRQRVPHDGSWLR